MTDQRRCKTCRWWQPVEEPKVAAAMVSSGNGPQKGLCKYGPPIAIAMPMQTKMGQTGIQSMAVWPPVTALDWCREHEEPDDEGVDKSGAGRSPR
jgi:hypothetical protein